MHHMNSVTLDKLGNLSTCACRGLKFRRIYTYQKKKNLGGFLDLGFRVEEETVKAPNWLWFNEFF